MTDESRGRQDAADVAQWLRRHPQFLEHYPDLAATLTVPRDAGASTSLASYQLEVLREKNRELTRRLHELSGHAQVNERLAVRTHQLTLALLRANTPARTLATMVAVLREDFEGDVVRVLLSAPAAPALQAQAELGDAPWLASLDDDAAFAGALREQLADGEPACGRLPPERSALVFGADAERVASAALLPVAGVGAVAVGSIDANRFFPGMGTLFLRMMGEALAVAMGRFTPAP